MDEADMAQDHIERESVGQLAQAHKPTGPLANGRCHWCDELIDDNRRWCPDMDCRGLWERYRDRAIRSGAQK